MSDKPLAASGADSMTREQTGTLLQVSGSVQGVGFRPFVYRLALHLGLSGSVCNTGGGVQIKLWGSKETIERFTHDLQSKAPATATITRITETALTDTADGRSPAHENKRAFTIESSTSDNQEAFPLVVDQALCGDCRSELFDPSNRRFNYAFMSCTQCGPRFSIIRQLPFDRGNTSMAVFKPCNSCQREYNDPENSRFHQQNICCANCGPSLQYQELGKAINDPQEVLDRTVTALRVGKIVALKAVGGFQLLVDARNEQAVMRLRQRKNRPAKPLALMFKDSDHIKSYCQCSALEEKLLLSTAAPIVLLRRRDKALNGSPIAPSVAPLQTRFGAFLPYTAIHHLLCQTLEHPIVVTSGNSSGHPLCFDNADALQSLTNIADAFLLHNLDITNPLDDSVLQLVEQQPQCLRMARGLAPATIELQQSPIDQHSASPLPDKTACTLAVGAEHKSAIAFSKVQQLLLSPYIGNLFSIAGQERLERSITSLEQLMQVKASHVCHDLHPHYQSTQLAQNLAIPTCGIQHHQAHIAACLVEHGIKDPVLGVCWDGTGYAEPEQSWGGEFFIGTLQHLDHVGTFSPCTLIGNEQAIKDPRRIAVDLLLDYCTTVADGPGSEFNTGKSLPAQLGLPVSERQYRLWREMKQASLNSPRVVSVGRLFDGVAALLGFHGVISYEGEAACYLQYLAECADSTDYTEDADMNLVDALEVDGLTTLSVGPLIAAIVQQKIAGWPASRSAALFHHTLSQAVVIMARHYGIQQVLLSGGCFQNRLLLSLSIKKLRNAGFDAVWPQRFPINDSGIAIGQLGLTLCQHQQLESS